MFVGNSNSDSMKLKATDNTLQTVLQQIEGVGKISVYIHYEAEQASTSLFDGYFQPTSNNTSISGVLVVAEGAKSATIQRKLIQTLSNVLQVSEHRIVIVPMDNQKEAK